MNWHPIGTAPLNVPLLVCGPDYLGRLIITGAEQDEFGWDTCGCGGSDRETTVKPTHWMPLPDPPMVK